MSTFALGLGVGSQSSTGELLEVYFNQPLLNPSDELIAAVTAKVGYEGGNQNIQLTAEQLNALEAAFLSVDAEDQAEIVEVCKGTQQPMILTILATDDEPQGTADAYLKLSLISNRLVQPHGLNLTGIFGKLPNVAWTNEGAISLTDLPKRQLAARAQGRIIDVHSVDKFPKMANYVVPAGTRIAATSRVRLGAHVGEGTTVMHEGFINFNAGTLGVSMVEGRISAGVVVGNGSDLGGGCSTMGTLSGGNNVVISVGENCLMGANAGLGLPLGDRCTVEAGLYVTAGSKVTVLDDQNNEVSTVKAAELAGKPDLLFRRNSQNGRVEVKTNKTAIELNNELHAHN